MPCVWLTSFFLFGRGTVEVDEAHTAMYSVVKVVDTLAYVGIGDENRMFVHLVSTGSIGKSPIYKRLIVKQVFHGITSERYPVVACSESQFVASVGV